MAKYKPTISNDIKILAKDLKSSYELSDYESLSLALKAEQNDLFRWAYIITESNNRPTALEAIANALGHIQ
jgi:hypothetical protein